MTAMPVANLATPIINGGSGFPRRAKPNLGRRPEGAYMGPGPLIFKKKKESKIRRIISK